MMKLVLSFLLFPSAWFGDAFTVRPLPAKDWSPNVRMAVPQEGKDIDQVTASGEEVSQDLFTIGLGDHGVVTVDGYKPDDFIAQAFDPELVMNSKPRCTSPRVWGMGSMGPTWVPADPTGPHGHMGPMSTCWGAVSSC